MRCSHVRKLLSPYIDGELSDSKTEKIRHHVSHCAICRKELQILQNLDALSKETYAHEPSEAYWANFLPRLHQKIEAVAHRSYWEKTRHVLQSFLFPSNAWLKTAGAVASVVLIFLVGRAVIQHKGTDTLLTAPGEERLREKIEHAADADQEVGKVGIEDTYDIIPPGDIAEQEPSLDLGGEKEDIPPPVIAESKDRKAPSPITQDRGSGYVSISPTTKQGAEEIAEPLREVHKPSKKMQAVTGDESQWTYEQALRSQRLGEKKSASDQFQYIIEYYPKSHVADDAQFQLNLAQRSITKDSQTLEGWQQQRDAWQDFLETYPHSELVDEACLRLAESWYHLANMTLTQEDLLNALEANRSCQKKLKGEGTLQGQIQELERVLKEQK